MRFVLGLCLFGAVATASAQAPRRASATATAPRRAIELRYLGNAGWEISDGRTVVLVDPYISQFHMVDSVGGQPRPMPLDSATIISPDTASIDARIPRADYILVTHGHLDHALDAPYIANKTGAVIIGNESVANIARAYAVPDSQLIVVRGGEDYAFGTFSLKVIPSIHSALFHKHYYTDGRPAGTAPRGLKAPLKASDFLEGQSMAFLLRLAGHQVVIMGSMNYIEREMSGLRPDVALVGANNQRKEIFDYAGRLMRALGDPALVMPTHWDVYGFAPSRGQALATAEEFAREIKAASPRTRVIIPEYFKAIRIP
jgi:L-ascorbate metabolism protein UlaG (beta-lactamase superfamily)